MLKVQTVISLVPRVAVRTKGVQFYLVSNGQKTLEMKDVLLAAAASPNLLVSVKDLRFYLLNPQFPAGHTPRPPLPVATDALKQYCLRSLGSSAEEVLLYPIAKALISGGEATDEVQLIAGNSTEDMTYSRLQREYLPFEMHGLTPHQLVW